MKVTKREFRIAAAASLLGFFFCYFLAGQAMPPSSPGTMTIIYSTGTFSDTPPATNQWVPQIHLPGAQIIPMNGPAPAAAGFATKGYSELGQPSRRNVDLFSSRYRVEVDLSDLQ
jgi:hypothetical protein